MFDIKLTIQKEDTVTGEVTFEERCVRWPCIPRIGEMVQINGMEYEVHDIRHDFDQETGLQVIDVALAEEMDCDDEDSCDERRAH